MNLKRQLTDLAAADGFLLITTPYSFCRLDRFYPERLENDAILGHRSDYKDPPDWFRIMDRDERDTGICFRRGSKPGIAARNADQPARKYEYEYTFARYLARYVARRMKREGKPIFHLRIHSDNHYRYWFNGSDPQARCFARRFESAWRHEVCDDYPDLKWRQLQLGVAHTDTRLTFWDMSGASYEQIRAVFNLLDAARTAEKIDSLTGETR